VRAKGIRHASESLGRQYTHIKDGLLERGKPEPLAEEIAARVVNKERVQHGESVQASASSINDISAGRRGGLRSQKGLASERCSSFVTRRVSGV
jgi:hypothetical protein